MHARPVSTHTAHQPGRWLFSFQQLHLPPGSWNGPTVLAACSGQSIAVSAGVGYQSLPGATPFSQYHVSSRELQRVCQLCERARKWRKRGFHASVVSFPRQRYHFRPGLQQWLGFCSAKRCSKTRLSSHLHCSPPGSDRGDSPAEGGIFPWSIFGWRSWGCCHGYVALKYKLFFALVRASLQYITFLTPFLKQTWDRRTSKIIKCESIVMWLIEACFSCPRSVFL